MTTLSFRPDRYRESDCSISDFATLVDQVTDLGDYPHAADVASEILLYDTASLVAADRAEVEAELVRALTTGPGVVVLRAAFPDHPVVERVTAAFEAIIGRERAAGGPVSDHFAAAGANDRVWNALEKLALLDPPAFVDYYSNEALALVSNAWLGPSYQMTSQVNVVRPGGRAQDPHRDYHLGFLSDRVAAAYPAHVHRLSPALTLQGAVAHSDMPVESGPTMYLPYSHQYGPGYLAWRRPEFRSFFLTRYVQLPLSLGDAVFFNPALFHGAGSNVSRSSQRMANLLQVSSAFGRAMETVDRAAVCRAVYPSLLSLGTTGVSGSALLNAVTCAADGYPFPTDLDLDPNIAGLTPQSQAELMLRAVAESWPVARVHEELDAYAARHRS
jgi:ectoine hydroxylase-related dioxygenase (phytanoyl-CoA dioxygenase family)